MTATLPATRGSRASHFRCEITGSDGTSHPSEGPSRYLMFRRVWFWRFMLGGLRASARG